MPFIEQKRRDVIDIEGLKDDLLDGGVQPGDICYFYYSKMVEEWNSNPRWRTAHGIYAKVLNDSKHHMQEDHRIAMNLAWQVFFNMYVIPYERAAEARNGTI